MKRRVVVVGAGMGGLTAALRLAQYGFDVTVFEARAQPGGLASHREIDGFRFDAGPYVLLDRPGLEWVFAELGLTLDNHLPLHRIAHVYEVASGDDPPVRIDDSLEWTVRRLEDRWPGSGEVYENFIHAAWRAYRRLQPLQRISKVTLVGLLQTGAWRDATFLWRTLNDILQRTHLPEPVRIAIGIWTHVAGQAMRDAPGPLAFVPALIHHTGAWYPINGIGHIPVTLAEFARKAGVEFRFNTRINAIRCDSRSVRGIESDEGEFVPADAIVADSHGVGTYLQLLDGKDDHLPRRALRQLEKLPLQSPGVCAYLAVKCRMPPPYLRFRLPGAGELCRLLVTPSALPIDDGSEGDHNLREWFPARLMAPMDHNAAESGGVNAQREYLNRILDESWWRQGIKDHRVLATRLPCEWGREFHLYRNSMNPVMTTRFMRAGRLAHRSPYVKRLYLAGSSTHPGQWVSFCAASGILAADCLRKDLA